VKRPECPDCAIKNRPDAEARRRLLLRRPDRGPNLEEAGGITAPWRVNVRTGGRIHAAALEETNPDDEH
jgi:hypothetical protein